jgi:hypothetical protein
MMRHGVSPRSGPFYAINSAQFRTTIFAAHNFVHHLADIGQASPPLGIGLGAVAPSTLFFPDNPFQDRRAATVIEAILFDGLFSVTKTKTYRIRIVEHFGFHS